MNDGTITILKSEFSLILPEYLVKNYSEFV